MGKTDSYRRLLLSIAQELTSDNFKDMKFSCDDKIPDGVLERLIRPIDLLTELEHRDLLSEGNKDFLAELLLQIGRQELARKLLGMNEEGLNSCKVHLCFKKIIYFVYRHN
jgi:hypothetical protein